jgi:putative FmdB family regulatory protein
LPIIDYKCPKCEVVMPIFRKVDEAEILYKCSNCEIAMERVWAAPAVHFKGTGWGKD